MERGARSKEELIISKKQDVFYAACPVPRAACPVPHAPC
jgi:hypothetical protein